MIRFPKGTIPDEVIEQAKAEREALIEVHKMTLVALLESLPKPPPDAPTWP